MVTFQEVVDALHRDNPHVRVLVGSTDGPLYEVTELRYELSIEPGRSGVVLLYDAAADPALMHGDKP